MHVIRDANQFSARVFTALAVVNTHHASLPSCHLLDSHGQPARSLHVIEGQRADPSVYYVYFLISSFLVTLALLCHAT